jgi:uncharacterized membrane protein
VATFLPLLPIQKAYRLADTQALVIYLAKSPPRPASGGYTVYLDNIFTNIPLAKALGELSIGVIETTVLTKMSSTPWHLRKI